MLAMLAEATLRVERLERPVTLRVVTLVTDKLEVPVIFKEAPKTEETFRDVTLVLDRLEVPVTFKFVPKMDAAFRDEALHAERLEVPETLREFRIPKLVMLGWAG